MKVQRSSWRSIRPLVVSVVAALLIVAAGQASAAKVPPVDDVVTHVVNPYADVSDEALNKLMAESGELDHDQRQALFSEVKMRMARQSHNLRRYGTVVRRGTIHIKIRKGQRYGLGFEQRSAQAASAQAVEKQATPVVKVTDPN